MLRGIINDENLWLEYLKSYNFLVNELLEKGISLRLLHEYEKAVFKLLNS